MKNEESRELRKQVIALATALALQETAEKGTDYSEAITKALEEACKRLDKEEIKMLNEKTLFNKWEKGGLE